MSHHRTRISARLSLTHACLLLLALVTAGARAEPAAARDAAVPETIAVMTYNVWRSDLYGWADPDWDDGVSRGQRTAEVIARSGADVIGLQEYQHKLDDNELDPNELRDAVAELTGQTWYYAPTAAGGVLSRFEIVDTSPGNHAARLRMPSGRHVWIVNAHFGLQRDWSKYYLPYAAVDPEIDEGELVRRCVMNWDLAELPAGSEGLHRTTQWPQLREEIVSLLATSEPVFFTADFNEPSHLDWTERAVEAGLIPKAVNAPLSRAIHDLGLQDGYHVDRVQDGRTEVERWGYTWTPGADQREDMHADDDRIDMVYFSGKGLRVINAETLGEEGGKWVDRSFGKWPSDHRAVVVRFLLEPTAAPYGLQTEAERLAALPRSGNLRVLVWNIQRGANAFDAGAEKALAIIRAVDPDLCLLQESYDIEDDRPTLGRWLAEQLGWNAHQAESPHLCVLTPMTISERYYHHPWHGVGATLTDENGRALIAYSIWIDYRAYTPYHLRDEPDVTDESLLLNETERSGRFAQAEAIIAHLDEAGHLRAEAPLLVGGDWNCPSHLDWTDETAKVYRFRRDLDLPVSLAMADAGFSDVFRMVHREPVQSPGITWSPLYRGSVDEPETADRIDRLYLHRRATSSVLTPLAAYVLPKVYEAGSVPVEQRTFPSDHGCVVIDFQWD
jgi:exodeoxyribonuclease-3